MKARVIIGANLGDEGKGTIVAQYAQEAMHQRRNVLNVLTNGGAQRAHSVLTSDGDYMFQHFGSGTCYGADSYFSCYFILNPMQFVKEYKNLESRKVFETKLSRYDVWYGNAKAYRHPQCAWSTPFDMMANQMLEELRADRKHGSCGMGIWETIKRYQSTVNLTLDEFNSLDNGSKFEYVKGIRQYFENLYGWEMQSDAWSCLREWKDVWFDEGLINHFIDDCVWMGRTVQTMMMPVGYDEIIFENGQGLMLKDTGRDTAGTTPSDTGCWYAMTLANKWGLSVVDDVTYHIVTRPYLTRHGRGFLEGESQRADIARDINEDRHNHFNPFQEDFRFGTLDIEALRDRIVHDFSVGIDETTGVLVRYKYDVYTPFNKVIELTHCDEMDRFAEFNKVFASPRLRTTIRTTDTPLVKTI